MAQIVQVELIVSFRAAPAGQGDELAEIAVTVRRGGKDNKVVMINDKAAGGNEFQAVLAGVCPATDNAGQRGFVGQCQGLVTGLGGALDQFLRMRGAA